MKKNLVRLSILSLLIPQLSFTASQEIHSCYITYSDSELSAASPDRLPPGSEQVRQVKTEKGEVDISRTDGYRVLYKNKKDAPFVNLKVELSAPGSYEKDQKNLMDNLHYLIVNGVNMESKDVIEKEFNGYKVYGLSRNSIASGSTLGIFIMFPGDGVTVYFYFNNLTPDFRNFESVEDYQKQRDRFINDYTKYLSTCKK